MELFFFGTSSGWPLPRLGCTCSICRSKDPKDNRLRPSILINNQLLLDAPPDIYHQIKKFQIDPTAITHIAITHAHDDHIVGLYDFSHIYNQKQKVILLTTRGVYSQIRSKLFASLTSFKFLEIKPGLDTVIQRDINIYYMSVIHSSQETYAIKVKAPKPILYAPEFRKILPSYYKTLGDLDLAIIDGSSLTNYGQAAGHETIEEGIRFAKNIKSKKVLFTNIGHKTDTHSNLEVFVKEKGGEKFGIAYDGLKINL